MNINSNSNNIFKAYYQISSLAQRAGQKPGPGTISRHNKKPKVAQEQSFDRGQPTKAITLMDNRWKLNPSLEQFDDETATFIIRLLETHPFLPEACGMLDVLECLHNRVKLENPSPELKKKWDILAKVIQQPTLKLRANNNQEIECCTSVLAFRSDMVAALLTSGMKIKPIELNFSTEEIQLAYRFFQTEDSKLVTDENALPLLRLCDYLQAPKLNSACIDKLVYYAKVLKFCDRENLFALFSVAIDIQNSRLKEVIREKILMWIRQIFAGFGPLVGNFMEIKARLKKIDAPIDIDLGDLQMIHDCDLSRLEGLNIRNLNLRNCSNLTEKAVDILSRGAFTIQCLILEGNDWITDSGCKRLSKIEKLSKLYLRGCKNVNVTDKGKQHVEPLIHLQKFKRSGEYSELPVCTWLRRLSHYIKREDGSKVEHGLSFTEFYDGRVKCEMEFRYGHRDYNWGYFIDHMPDDPNDDPWD